MILQGLHPFHLPCIHQCYLNKGNNLKTHTCSQESLRFISRTLSGRISEPLWAIFIYGLSGWQREVKELLGAEGVPLSHHVCLPIRVLKNEAGDQLTFSPAQSTIPSNRRLTRGQVFEHNTSKERVSSVS